MVHFLIIVICLKVGTVGISGLTFWKKILYLKIKLYLTFNEGKLYVSLPLSPICFSLHTSQGFLEGLCACVWKVFETTVWKQWGPVASEDLMTSEPPKDFSAYPNVGSAKNYVRKLFLCVLRMSPGVVVAVNHAILLNKPIKRESIHFLS